MNFFWKGGGVVKILEAGSFFNSCFSMITVYRLLVCMSKNVGENTVWSKIEIKTH